MRSMIKKWLAILISRFTEAMRDRRTWAAFREFKRAYPTPPQHQGRSLKSWLEDYFLKDGVESDSALEAVRQMGAAAIPYLVALVRFDDFERLEISSLSIKTMEVEMKRFKEENQRGDQERQRIIDLVRESERTGVRIDRPPYESTFKPGYSDYRYEFRLAALFRALRREAGPAVPELAALFDWPYGLFNISKAASALVGIGKEGMGPLLTALHHENNHVRSSVLHAMQFLDSEFEIAVPALLRCFNDPDSDVRGFAVGTLHTHMDARRILCTDEILRALIDCLSDSDETVQRHSIVAFTGVVQAGVGSKAETAIPALSRAASAGSDQVQLIARLALSCIEHPLRTGISQDKLMA